MNNPVYIKIIKAPLINKGINALIKKGNKIQALKIIKNLCNTFSSTKIENKITKLGSEYKTKLLKNKVEISEALTLEQKQQEGLKKIIRESSKRKGRNLTSKLSSVIKG